MVNWMRTLCNTVKPREFCFPGLKMRRVSHNNGLKIWGNLENSRGHLLVVLLVSAFVFEDMVINRALQKPAGLENTGKFGGAGALGGAAIAPGRTD